MFNFTVKEFILGNGTGTPTLQFYRKGFVLGGTSSPSWQDIILSGNTALTLVNAKADGLNYLKLFGKCEQRNLPSEYTQVEYLESTGTQYINTGVDSTDGYTINTNILFTSFSSNQVITGSYSRSGGGAVTDSARYFLRLNSGTGNLFYQYNSSASYGSTVLSLNTRYNIKCKLTKNSQYLEVDGILKEETTISADQAPASLFFLAVINASDMADNLCYARVYSCQYYDNNNVIVRNFIPCRRNSDNVVGMYDTVSQTFFTNAGTGTFTAGADVTPTPDTPMDIVCNNGVLKYSPNLFDKNNTLADGTIWVANGQQSSYANFYGANPISVQGGKTYTRTADTGSDNFFLLENNTYVTVSNSSNTITVPNNAVLWLFNYNTSVSRDEVMVVKGNALPNTYFPYVPNGIYTDGTTETVTVDTTGGTATAEMLLKVGDYKDEQEVLTGSVTRNIGIKVLDGTENWTQSGTSTPTKLILYMSLGSQPAISENCRFMSTHYPQGDSVSNLGFYTSNPTNIFINLLDTFSSVADFKTYLASQYNAGTPVIVIYPLAEPTTETVTPQPLTTQAGTNIVEITQASIDNLGLEVSYKAVV